MASNAVILWVLGGAGALLLYSAVKNQHPETVLLSSLQMGGNAAAASPIAANTKTGYEGTNPEFHGSTSIPAQGNPLQGYWHGTDKNMQNTLYSGTGQIIGNVPTEYNSSPATFIYSEAIGT